MLPWPLSWLARLPLQSRDPSVEGRGAMSDQYPEAHEIYWVYMRNSARSWTVGFYDRRGQWRHRKNCFTQEAAAAYVNKLNGSQVRVRAPKVVARMDCQG